MGSKKLSAIWRILTSSGYVAVTVGKGKVKYLRYNNNADLASNMTLSIALQRVNEELTEEINTRAAEAGQLHAMQALRDSVQILENSNE